MGHQTYHRYRPSMLFLMFLLIFLPEISAPPTVRQWEAFTLWVNMWVGKLLQGPEQSWLEHNDTEPELWNHMPGLILGSAIYQLCISSKTLIFLCLNSSIQNLEVILSSAFFLTPNAQNNKCCRLCWERGGLIHSLLTPTWPSNERFLNGWMDEWLDRWMEEWRGG